MRIIEDVRNLEELLPNLVLTIGSFDGVHLGHQKVLEELILSAKEIDGCAGLMTMRPHPRHFFSPAAAPNILTSDAKKAALLREAGVEALLYLPFNAEVASMSPAHFVEEILVRRCRIRRLIIGHDFCFGKNAEGNYEFLMEAAPIYGFEVVQTPQVVIQGERVSSTLIREYIVQGELEAVEPFLGRKYSIMGEVMPGRGMGVKLGFPTANIEPHHNAVPAHGVYAAEALLDKQRYWAAVNIGVAPTIRHEDVTIEAHLLNFSGYIVGQPVEIIFHKRLRPEKKFPSKEALIQAIADDVEKIRRYFVSCEKE